MPMYLFIENKQFRVGGASGFVPPDALMEVHDRAHPADFYEDQDGDIIERPHLEIRGGNYPFLKSLIDYYGSVYRRTKMQPVIVKENGEIKIVLLPHGAKHSGQIMLAPSGFKPGDEKYIKEIEDGIEIDFKSKEEDLRREHGTPEELRRAEEWNTQSVTERLKRSIFGG